MADFSPDISSSTDVTEPLPKTKPESASLPPTTWSGKLAQWDISHFAISLALSAFTAMWKSVSPTYIIHIPSVAYIALWGISLSVAGLTLALYLLRAILWPRSIMWDFRNPRLVNFFFVPVIMGSMLTVGAPDSVMGALPRKIALGVLTTYQVLLSVYLYGEWLFGNALIEVTHPVLFMQVIGYFLMSNLASTLMLIELARALVAVGLVFWAVVFVTNFQHTSSELRRRQEKPAPTFFLFIAPPAAASIALAMLSMATTGSLGDDGFLVPAADFAWPQHAKAVLYVDLFIYLIIFRVFPAFLTDKFAIVWWAYIFPLSAAAGAAFARGRFTSGGTEDLFWQILSGLLVGIATLALAIVAVSTFWGIAQGRLPSNQGALAAYYASKKNGPSDVESTWGSVKGGGDRV